MKQKNKFEAYFFSGILLTGLAIGLTVSTIAKAGLIGDIVYGVKDTSRDISHHIFGRPIVEPDFHSKFSWLEARAADAADSLHTTNPEEIKAVKDDAVRNLSPEDRKTFDDYFKHYVAIKKVELKEEWELQ